MSKKKRKKTIIIFVSLLIIVSIILYFVLYKYNGNNKIVDKIDGYTYTLDDRDTDLVKSIFGELKTNLNSKEVDYVKYAESISKLFVADLYTMQNKSNKYDVGGRDYIYPDHVDNYKLKVEDTLYLYLEDISTRKNNKDLPVVTEIEANFVEEGKFQYMDNEYSSYIVDLQWEYEKNLGYDHSAKITVINIENKLYIADFNVEVSE